MLRWSNKFGRILRIETIMLKMKTKLQRNSHFHKKAQIELVFLLLLLEELLHVDYEKIKLKYTL